MTSTEERMRILMMIQEGKISAEEAAQLIAALEEISEKPKSNRPAPPSMTSPGPNAPKPRFMKVMVSDTRSGKVKVNVRLPVSLINSGIRLGAKFAPEIEGLDMDVLNTWLSSGEIGQIVDVFDEEDGEHVQVFLE